ncbi:hypothetical protein [Bradyrhizobium sp. CCBAU 21360]|uniref:hypothetical protein n=1 Tax=Bradyrhizobium sp. CCBAU 21360 TaxID=1325081 RepID=UPI003FA4BF86|nr:hypothetical protein [Bradyrhizobium sp. CCBAU 21360]
MNVKKDAPLTSKGREAMMMRSVVEGGLSQAGLGCAIGQIPKRDRRMASPLSSAQQPMDQVFLQKGRKPWCRPRVVHLAIDDASCLAFSQIWRDQKKESASPSSRIPLLTTAAWA